MQDRTTTFFSNPRVLGWYANFDRRNNHHGVGIFTRWNGKILFNFIGNKEDTCIRKKLNGSAKTFFLIFYVDDISLITRYVTLLDTIKVSFENWFSSEKTWIKTMLSTKIYGDKLRHLIRSSHST
jgi:hypothetical protein